MDKYYVDIECCDLTGSKVVVKKRCLLVDKVVKEYCLVHKTYIEQAKELTDLLNKELD